MNIIVVGDVHGCFNTFNTLIENHWDKNNEVLVQLGDLIDRGNFSVQMLLLTNQIYQEFNNSYFLKGNHEYEFIKHILNGPNDNWLRQGGHHTLNQFQREGIDINNYLKWMTKMPLKWENENILVTHAGIAIDADDPYDEADRKGVLWNRGQIKNTGKLQIIGHTPTQSGKPEFDPVSNSYNIDSGAYLNHGLSAVKVSVEGKILETIHIATDFSDIQKFTT